MSMRRTAWSLAIAFGALIAVSAAVPAAPVPAGGLAGAAATLDSVEVVRGRGHFKRRHAGRHHGFHRHRVRHHRWRHHRVHRPRRIYWHGYRRGHLHCHRHFRGGYLVRHCHWHRHGHH
jgi:hypothetical protein